MNNTNDGSKYLKHTVDSLKQNNKRARIYKRTHKHIRREGEKEREAERKRDR